MASPSSVAKHPIHPMLVVFPLGLWIFSLVADIIYLSGDNQVWADVAFYCILGGIVGAVIAAIPGLIDLISLRPSRARTVGIWHMILNVSALVLYIINLSMRTRVDVDYTTPFVLSIIGVIGLLISGWLGGEMVYVHGVAVEPTASLDYTPQQRKVERKTTDIGVR